MARGALAALALAACGSHAPLELVPSATIASERVATPVRSSRLWTTALAPNKRGGWNLIAMAYELHGAATPEFIVGDLETGAQHSTPGLPEIYANTNYQIENQVRAENGRIFFPEADGHLAYYDPDDERVHQLDRVVPDKLMYKLVFGPDGQLYGGTQADGLPTLFRIDPATLAVIVLGHVGHARNGFSYAYDLAIDPPWIYATVGESPWELAALDARTGQASVIATRDAYGWMKLQSTERGASATLIANRQGPNPERQQVWLRDGALATEPPGRDVRARAGVLHGAPAITVPVATDGAGRFGKFKVAETQPVTLEGLFAAADGSVLGQASQYHGLFRYDPRARTTTVAPLPLSQGVFASAAGRTFVAGYPNGMLVELGRTEPLGHFTAAGAHYAAALVASGDALYFAGRRERDGVGSGLGRYDLATHQFIGTHEQLENLQPRGLAVVGDRVVLSGAALDGKDGTLAVFDRALRPLARPVVKPGATSTGEIYPAEGNAVVGLVREARAAYRYDVVANRLLAWREVGAIGPTARRPDGSLWWIAGTMLERLDPATLEITHFGEVRDLGTPTALAWQGDELYAIAGADLRKLQVSSRRARAR